MGHGETPGPAGEVCHVTCYKCTKFHSNPSAPSRGFPGPLSTPAVFPGLFRRGSRKNSLATMASASARLLSAISPRNPREIHPSALLASVISPRSFSNGRYGQTERGRRRQFRFQTPQVRNYNSTKFHDNPCIPSIGSPFPIYFPRASRSFSPRTAGLIGLSRLGLFPALFLMDGTGKRRKGESGNSVYRPLMSRTPTPPSFSSIRACNL